MSTSALASQGMTIAVQNTSTSPLSYDTITEVTSIVGPDGSAGEIDVTDLSSSAKSYRRGLPDNGTVSLSIMYIPANTQHAQLFSDFSASTETSRYYRISFTDSPATTWTFQAYVSGFSVSNELDGVTTADVSLRIKGTITEA